MAQSTCDSKEFPPLKSDERPPTWLKKFLAKIHKGNIPSGPLPGGLSKEEWAESLEEASKDCFAVKLVQEDEILEKTMADYFSEKPVPREPVLETSLDEEALEHALKEAMQEIVSEKPVQGENIAKEPVLETSLDEEALEHALKEAMQDYVPAKPIPGESAPGASFTTNQMHFVPHSSK